MYRVLPELYLKLSPELHLELYLEIEYLKLHLKLYLGLYLEIHILELNLELHLGAIPRVCMEI